MEIGLIGFGMVGNAVYETFKLTHKVTIYDKFKDLGKIENILNTKLVFVCVPTPTNEDGTQDLKPLHNVLNNLSKLQYYGVIVIKCTVLPGTCDALSAAYPNLKIVHNPEFLTERNAVEDFRYQKEIALSSPSHENLEVAMEAYTKAIPGTRIHLYNTYETTELGKYIHNCFLATKVAFFNEIYNLCKQNKFNFEHAVELAKNQGVIGASHTKVPGPDGKLGFGGACFPKDTLALLTQNKETLSILNAVVESNKKQLLNN